MRKSVVVKGVLLALVGGVVLVAPGAAIPLGALAKLLCEAQYSAAPYKAPEESDPEKVRQSIYRLRKNEYLKIKSLGGKKFKFELTKKGKKLLARYHFSDFKINSQKRWDGLWRMFTFDIPEKKRLLRDSLRKRLQELGFFRFQKSVWIYPFECAEEMRMVCEFLEIQPYTITFTGKINDDYLLRKHFVYKRILTKSDLWKKAMAETQFN